MIRIGVVGVGRMGSVHARNLAAGTVKGARLSAVCDHDKAKTAAFVKRGIAEFTDYREMIESGKVDAVIVATEHREHRKIAEYALSHGISCLVEKPLCVTVSEARKLVETANEHKAAVFGVMYNQRTNRMYRKAKEMVEGGVLGDIRRANFIITNWYRSQAYYDQGGWRACWSGEGGGTLINQCIHQLDVLQWIVGMPDSVSAVCRTVNRNITTENDVTAVFSYGDFDCSFTASAHELHGVNRLEIAGTKGRLVVTPFSMKYVLFHKSENEVNATTKKGYGSVGVKKRGRVTYGLFRLLKDLLLGQQRRVVEAFAAAVSQKDDGLLVAKGEEGLRALTLINAVYLSDWQQSKVALPMDEELYEKLLSEHAEKEILR